jgi:hypothetical protein
VDVGAAQVVGFVNKQHVEFTVGEIEGSCISAGPTVWDAAASRSYVSAGPTVWDAAASTGNVRRNNLSPAISSAK